MTFSRESKTIRILLIEKGLPEVELIGQKLQASYTHLFEAHYATDAVEALAEMVTERFDCVLMSSTSGYVEKTNLLMTLQQEYPDFEIPVIELNYQKDQLTARICKAEGTDILVQSHPDNLQKIVKDALKRKYRAETLPQLRIQYREAQRNLQNRERQIQRLKLAIEKGKEQNRLHEQALKETLRRLSFHFENTPLAVIEWDAEFKVRRWSKEAENLFGWPAREVLGKTFHEFRFVPEEDWTEMNQLTGRLTGGESKNVFQSRNYHQSGRILHCEWCTSTSYNERKEPEPFISIVQDVTQLRQKEQMLVESQERFHKLSQASFDGMAIHDEGTIVEFNERLAEILGYGKEELIGSNGFRFFTNDSLERILENIKEQSEIPYEVTAIRKDGALLPVEIAGKSILFDNRELSLITVRDITERKKAESAIQESEVRFRSTFEQAAVGLLHVDLEGRLIRVNQKICDIAGYTREELLSRTIFDLLDQEHLAKDREIFVRVMKGEIENYVSEQLSVLKNGRTRWINLNVARVVDDQTGRAIYFVAVVEDISERKKAEVALQEVNAELDTFVYNASHDLRGPIASLLGLCSVAQLEVTDPEARNYLTLIKRTAAQMNEVLLSLILMSRVKNHKAQRSRLDFQSLFDETLQSLCDEDGFGQVQFSADIHLSGPFYSDATLVANLLKNTLENAIRFRNTSHRQTSQVTMQVQETGGKKGILIRIRDNGLGVAAEVADNIFDMFFRGTERSTGPGLGLYIVRKITQKLGGSVHLNRAKDPTELVIFLPQMEG
ncbi:MAG: PAS domain S-box protein [Ferruginibacter sp.]|nr:PAS domain S-box protein [Cytophagales bacterium]